MSERREVSIKVPVLARVEGEGALDIEIKDGRIDKLALRIFEPPRLFEKLLEGRGYGQVPDIVARICGICPVAYQMSAVHAIEQVFGVVSDPWVRAMRRLLYCGEWIESHALHIHLLAAPDFLGCNDVVTLARSHPQEVRRGMRLQATGNALIELVGGRSVHPVGVCVGGFYRAPTADESARMLARVRGAIVEAEALVAWSASLDLPQNEQDFISVALRHESEYPMNEGRLVSDDGLDIPIDRYPEYFREQHVPHSTALHARYYPGGIGAGGDGAPYLLGPLARLNLNWGQLPDAVRSHARHCGVDFPSRNMFHSIIGRSIEIHYALHEAARILEEYRLSDRPAASFTARAGVGFGCTEAPRGLLWHRYELDDQGAVRQATIIPPTSQNQARIEQDLHASLLAFGLDHEDDALRRLSERVVRNYDPCISCATHFLRLSVTRS